MTAVASLLLVIALSLLVVRIGAVALTLTGLSHEVAQFQALSAFTGAGFTSSEAEVVLNQPERRKIIAILIRLGSVGLVTGISSLLLSFIGADEAAPSRLLVLLVGIAVILWLARSRAFNKFLTPLIARVLARTTRLDLRDYANLLHLEGDYRIVELHVEEGGWLADRSLAELDLPSEGVLVLGVTRADGDYLGAPQADLRFRKGDVVVTYGREHRLDELAKRAAEDEAAHVTAKVEHERDIGRR